MSSFRYGTVGQHYILGFLFKDMLEQDEKRIVFPCAWGDNDNGRHDYIDPDDLDEDGNEQ